MIKDILKFRYLTMILKCDDKSALKSISEETKRRRTEPIIRENPLVGGSRANGVTGGAVRHCEWD